MWSIIRTRDLHALIAAVDRVERRVDRIYHRQTEELRLAMNERDLAEQLVSQVAGLTDVVVSVETTIDGMIEQIRNAAGSDVSPQLQQALDGLAAYKARLAAAVVKATPADPAPTEPLPEPQPPEQPQG